MNIQHHLDDASLLAYASGNMPEAFSLIIAAHVSLCDQCRATLESFNAVGGALLDTTQECEMGNESLQQALARLDAPTRTAEPQHRQAPAGSTFPAPLQDYVGGDLDAVDWRPLGMGVKQAILPTSSQASARLLLIPAGAAMPDHSHRGREFTMVLQGAFLDGPDRFARGDIEVADDDVQHTPIADIGEDCICLAVTDAPLKFKGWMPRLVQRLPGRH